MLIDYIKPKSEQSFEDFTTYTRSLFKTAVFGVSDPAKYILTASLSGKVLYIAKDPIKARQASEELHYLTGKKAVYLCAKDDVLLYKKAFNKDSLYQRLTALYEIQNGAEIVTASFEGLLQLLPKRVDFLTFNKGNEYALDGVLKSLVSMGYQRMEFVTAKGEFSLRGDILEVFPINGETAYRLDFFGDELEKIRLYDAYLHKSGEEVPSFTVISALDFTLNETKKEIVLQTLDKSIKNFKLLAVKNKARQIIDEIKDIIESGNNLTSLSFIAPILPYAENGVFDFLGENVTVIFDEAKLVKENCDGLIREHVERVKSLEIAGQSFDFSIRHYYDESVITDNVSRSNAIAFQLLTTQIPYFNILGQVRFNIGTLRRYALKFDELFTDLNNWKKSAYKVVICCGSSERAERLCDDLARNGVFCQFTETPQDFPGVYVTTAYLTSGCVFHDSKLVVIGTCDLYLAGKEKKKIKLRRTEAFSAPNVGDFAVHEKHGIGLVKGTERISTTEGTKDYVAIEYFGGDMLYVPVDQLDRLTKYLGGDKAPKLSRLGGMEFEKVKERVRHSISQMSINLKKLYGERAKKIGFKFSPDNSLTQEFEMAFPYEETEDQLQSIAEIKKDMESTKVMDRLLCGDVGFGKTEVAIRACFKAVLDNKQVAVIAPTTILTQQHYETFKKRFDDFGVKVALINRFIAPLKLKQTLKDIENGNVDIVIGTHKLFSGTVKFKDLGLLVIDEEQCFGVEHKEKLRVVKENVDTLTMTATPIPRTLHMSLSGIRDISLINTPPTNRIPVQAYVVEESDALITDAINREVARGGQVFLLYNRVETIYKYASKLEELMPNIRFCVAHGQMQKNSLEKAIMSFYNGEYDVLVSTTIIENGIDLPTANTLIVIDADMFGLFTLYQLKGRVGRSDKMAHAYFTFKPDKVLSETAYKRLSALMQHTELGSGYKIAMRDLEIRGAGNVMGKEQHGHMDKIGYELYSKLLKEQLGEVTKDFETELDIRMNAFIPEDYIEVSASRLDCYKTISEVRSEAELETVKAQIQENYGKLPPEVSNLLKIAMFKNCAQKCSVLKAVVSQKQCYLLFPSINALSGGVQNALENFKGKAVLSFEQNPKITFEFTESSEQTLRIMTEFLLFALKS